MSQVTRLLQAESTQHQDYDYTQLLYHLIGRKWGVHFSSGAKTELQLSGSNITPWIATIVCTRTATMPIGSQKTLAVFYSDANVPVVIGANRKIFIEINDTLIQNPVLIQDPSWINNYTLGLNIGEIKSALVYPAHSNYIKLYEFDWAGTPTDVRVKAAIDWLNVDLSTYAWIIAGASLAISGNATIGWTLNVTWNTVINGTLNANGYDVTAILAGSIDWGTWADGALNVTSGTTTLNTGQVYNFSSINVSAGATLAFTPGSTPGIILKCTWATTISWTINLKTPQLHRDQYFSIIKEVLKGWSPMVTMTAWAAWTAWAWIASWWVGWTGGALGWTQAGWNGWAALNAWNPWANWNASWTGGWGWGWGWGWSGWAGSNGSAWSSNNGGAWGNWWAGTGWTAGWGWWGWWGFNLWNGWAWGNAWSAGWSNNAGSWGNGGNSGWSGGNWWAGWTAGNGYWTSTGTPGNGWDWMVNGGNGWTGIWGNGYWSPGWNGWNGLFGNGWNGWDWWVGSPNPNAGYAVGWLGWKGWKGWVSGWNGWAGWAWGSGWSGSAGVWGAGWDGLWAAEFFLLICAWNITINSTANIVWDWGKGWNGGVWGTGSWVVWWAWGAAWNGGNASDILMLYGGTLTQNTSAVIRSLWWKAGTPWLGWSGTSNWATWASGLDGLNWYVAIAKFSNVA